MGLTVKEDEELNNLLILFNSKDITEEETKRLDELIKKEEEEFTPPSTPKKKKKTKNQKTAKSIVSKLSDDDELKQEVDDKVNKGTPITMKYLINLRTRFEEKQKLPSSEEETEKPTSTKTSSKETRDLVKQVKEDLDKISKSEAQKQQLKEITEKREKTKKDKEILKKALENKPIPDENPGTPSGRPSGRPAGAPIVKIKKTREHLKLPELQFPSTSIILAKKFSGKTNLLLNIVDKDKFDNVWVVSLTGFTGKLDGLCEDKECLLEDINDLMINELLKLHKETPMTSLIVLDDVIGQVDMRSKGMNKLATMGRNFGISIVISSQDFYKVPPIWRRNSEYYYIGSLTDSNIEAVSKELSVPSFTKKRIRQELSDIARDAGNHDWLFYDDRNTKFIKLFGNQFKVIV